MTGKTITVAGQRISIATPTDYQAMFLSALFDDGDIVVNQQKHSDFISLMVEVIAPTLPRSLYKKTASGYWWLGTAEEFGELLTGLGKAYAKEPESVSGKEPEASGALIENPSPESVQAELTRLRELEKKIAIDFPVA